MTLSVEYLKEIMKYPVRFHVVCVVPGDVYVLRDRMSGEHVETYEHHISAYRACRSKNDEEVQHRVQAALKAQIAGRTSDDCNNEGSTTYHSGEGRKSYSDDSGSSQFDF